VDAPQIVALQWERSSAASVTPKVTDSVEQSLGIDIGTQSVDIDAVANYMDSNATSTRRVGYGAVNLQRMEVSVTCDGSVSLDGEAMMWAEDETGIIECDREYDPATAPVAAAARANYCG